MKWVRDGENHGLLPGSTAADLAAAAAGVRQLLKRYPLHKCGHEGEERCSAADCLLAQLGELVARG